MRTTAFLSVCLLAVLAVPAQAGLAQAGQLFPPQNIGANANVKCPSGQVLTWNVDHVDCVDPTAGVTFTCPAGQVLTSIKNGQPVCLTLASGGGLTGGCRWGLVYYSHGSSVYDTRGGVMPDSYVVTIFENWGNGCRASGTSVKYQYGSGPAPNGFSLTSGCAYAANTGYACGPDGSDVATQSPGSINAAGKCLCVKN
jgi:hypothetical protein